VTYFSNSISHRTGAGRTSTGLNLTVDEIRLIGRSSVRQSVSHAIPVRDVTDHRPLKRHPFDESQLDLSATSVMESPWQRFDAKQPKK
jgi:hypothetical protein